MKNLKVLLIVIFLYSSAAYICTLHSENLASTLDGRVGLPLREGLSSVSAVFPFSVFELFMLTAPILFLFAVFGILKAKNVKTVRRKFFGVLYVVGCIASLYILTLGIAANREPYSSSLNSATEADLYRGAEYLLEKISADEPNALIPPSEKNLKSNLEETYSNILNKQIRLSSPKKLAFSRLFCYTGADAIYSFLTGEVNYTAELPRYMLPFAIAHEYAHFLGAGNETDANFAAFAVCISSNDRYIRYSGYLSGLEFIMQDILKASPEMYTIIYNRLPDRARTDIEEYLAFSHKYKNGNIFALFDKANRKYLNAVDSYGEKSYSAVTGHIITYIAKLS